MTVIHPAPSGRRGFFGNAIAPGHIDGEVGDMSVGGKASAGNAILLYCRRDSGPEVDLGKPYDGIRVSDLHRGANLS